MSPDQFVGREPTSFAHSFAPGTIEYGRGSVSRLGELLAEHGAKKALVVCGTNVGANDAVMDPIRNGLDDRLAGVFAQTTPQKSITTAFDGVERMRDLDADALVGVGSGSSLDTAAVMSVLQANDQSIEDVRREVESGGGIDVPASNALVPLFSVPTTFAGADLSAVAGINVPVEDGMVGSGVSGTEILPAGLCYDPNLFETTPEGALTGSAMNGFDKGIEALYSRNANPITDATAMRGLGFLKEALPNLTDSTDPEVMDRAVLGMVLVQYGVSIPGAMKLSLIHAFGHGLRQDCGVQQGIAHAVMAPHVLEYVFERVDGRREALAEGLGVEAEDDPAENVIDAVENVRDGLGLPSRLREVEAVAEDDLQQVAQLTHGDSMVANGPPDLEPTVEEIEAVLRAAW